MKILVTIASYGLGNDRYLERVIAEYKTFSHNIDIVVCSNVEKRVPVDVELMVGLPTRDPWSLPFAHKHVLASRVDEYDLFIYSEDDILVTEENVQSFLRVSAVLPDGEIPGFMRIEVAPDGKRWYPDVHKSFHWDPKSIVQRAGDLFGFFSCEHAACYLLTRSHLRSAMASGNFLVGPHQGKYDLACTASTDPYTQCGFKKLICISQFEKFLLPHLSNKYTGTEYGVWEEDFALQIQALLEIHQGKRKTTQLLDTETSFPVLRWSKSYYELPQPEILNIFPPKLKDVLSIGCGWGALEESLIRTGAEVTGIPLDSVISACAEARGVKTFASDFKTAWQHLRSQKFDCILISNVLHLVPDPSSILMESEGLLSHDGCIVIVTPNLNFIRLLARKIRFGSSYKSLGSYSKGHVHSNTDQLVRRLFKGRCNLQVKHLRNATSKGRIATKLRRFMDPYLSFESVLMVRRITPKESPGTVKRYSGSRVSEPVLTIESTTRTES